MRSVTTTSSDEVELLPSKYEELSGQRVFKVRKPLSSEPKHFAVVWYFSNT